MGKFDGYLMVSDMDATLLTNKHKVSDGNRTAIEYFMENGGKFTVATGRMIVAVALYLPYLPLNAPAVLYNGAKLYDFSSGKTYYEQCIEEERKSALKRVYNDFPKIGLEIYTNDEEVYIYRECDETRRFERRRQKVNLGVPGEVWDKKWLKVLYIADKKTINKFEPVYRRDYDNGYCVRSGSKYLDMVSGGVSKGEALKRLMKLTGAKKTIAVGDNMNDISMIETADIGAAVENAEKTVKQAADIIVPDNEHDAIKYIVENVLQ